MSINKPKWTSQAELEELVISQAEDVQNLSHASQRFQELFQGVPMACYCFDLDGRIIEWNRACEALFQVDFSTVLEQRVWDVIGRPTEKEMMRALIMGVVGGGVYENYEWEDEAVDGKTRYFYCNAYPMRDHTGSPIGGICANIDISERIYAEQALQESEERWQLALRGNSDGIWDWDLRRNRTFFSDRCVEILGYNPGEYFIVDRSDWLSRVHPDDIEKVNEAFQRHLDHQTAYYCAEYRVLCKSGDYKWISDRAQALWDRNLELLRVAGSFTDITERRLYEDQLHEANNRLEELAMKDGLTGVYNRRALEERLAMEYERVRRYRMSLSLMLLDVDHFKDYNDTFGHQQGDVVLKQFAALLDRNTRDVDFVARYGGEEFVILLPHTSHEGSKFVSERCLQSIRSHPWPCRAITASIGVSTLEPEDNIDWESLLKLADEAMYQSKDNGRDQITYNLPDG